MNFCRNSGLHVQYTVLELGFDLVGIGIVTNAEEDAYS
jgi:hypothetical protein